MKYEAAVFDLDGTLLESSRDDLDWLYNAIRDALRQTGKEKPASNLSERQLGKIAGLDGFHSYLRLCEQVGADPKNLWSHVSHFRAEYKFQQVKQGKLGEREGASELLQGLRQRSVKLGLVSNGPDESVDFVVRQLGWQRLLHFFRGITDLSDLSHRKPDPWHLRMASAELGGRSAVYVGNSVADVKAAENAGWDSVLIAESADTPATYTVNSLVEIEDVF